jgi:very-short-patch-repair endonuclease
MDLDNTRWRDLLFLQDAVVSHRQALAAGWSRRAVEHRVGRDWQRLLRGVYLTTTGVPTTTQRRRAALLLAGAGSALTAGTGLHVHEVLELSSDPDVHVALPEARRVVPDDFRVGGGTVVLHRTTRALTSYRADIPTLAVARCVTDAALRATGLEEVRVLVTTAVQRRRTTVADLEHELEQAPQRGSGFLRRALEEVAAGARSLPEAVLLKALRRVQLPPYRLNSDVYDERGRWLARPDLVIEEIRLAAEVDGQRWHLDAVRWVADVERHTRLEVAGWTVLRYPAARVLRDAEGVAREIAVVAAGLVSRHAS